MSTSVYLIRHAAYDHRPSAEGTEASSDFGLSALGLAQAQALCERLAVSREIEADALFSSTLPRARQTAALVSPVLDLEPQAIAELCEWESGNEILGADAFMKTFRELDPAQRRHHRFVPGFETVHEFTSRVQGKLAELVERHRDRTIVLVVHGGVIEVTFHHFLGFGPGPFEGGYPAAGNTSITLWRKSSRREGWVQEFANDTHHLRGMA
ncbi:MAG: histidine phosphatase family protein [Burkholderiales bacterium]